MPRKSKLQTQVEAAIAAFPFAPGKAGDDPTAYANLPAKVQAGIAKQIATDLALGATGNDCREKYAGMPGGVPVGIGLPGKLRREVLRAHGYGGSVRRSYGAYLDGDPRTGSAHASQHGAKAAERQAAKLAEVEAAAKAEQKKAERRAKAAERRAAKAAEAEAAEAAEAAAKPAEAAADAS